MNAYVMLTLGGLGSNFLLNVKLLQYEHFEFSFI